MSEWQDISTAPKDGTVFMVSDAAGLIQVCCIQRREERKKTVRRWFKTTEVVEREGGSFWYYALPFNGEYIALNMRGGSYEPAFWMPLPQPPEPSR